MSRNRFVVGLCALAAAATLAAAPAAAYERDGSDGVHELSPGAKVPFDPGHGTIWLRYDTVNWGYPAYFGNKPGIRMVGRFNGDHLLCRYNRGGMQDCYHDGKLVTRLGGFNNSFVATNDPAIVPFAPAIEGILTATSQVSSLSSMSSGR